MPTLKKLSFLIVALSAVCTLPAIAKKEIASIDCTATGVETDQGHITTVSKSNHNLFLNGNCEIVVLSGDGNFITTEKIKKLSILGDDNTVSVERIESIVSAGDRNTIFYRNEEPQKKSTGSNNAFHAGPYQLDLQTARKSAPTKKPAQTKTGPAAPTASGIIPSGLDNVWFIYNADNGAKWTAMTFNDGTLTTDVVAVFKHGVAASRKSKPKKWARYTKTDNGEQLVVKFPKWPRAKKYYKTDRSVRMNSDYKLTGCWRSSSSSNIGLIGGVGSSTFSSNEFCFDANGRFSNDSGLAISGSGGGRSLSTSLGGKHGAYRIDGNTVTLRYANGRQVSFLFGAYQFGTDHIAVISIGSRVYH